MHISTTATETPWPCTPIDGVRCSSCSALPMVILKSSSSSNSSLFIPRRQQKRLSFGFSFSSSPLKPVLSCCSCSPLAFATHQESSSAFLVTQGPKNETHEISGADFITTCQNDTNSISSLNDTKEIDWIDLEEDLFYWTKPVRPVQWYPGHIAKTEKELKDQLKLMDVVIEVRDARIPLATSHPQMDLWLGNRKKILVLNREDMISSADRNAWATYFARQGVKVIFANGQFGMGTMKLGRLARALALSVNVRRREKGLLPRPVRAGVVGYPNVGKSSLINRLLKRRKCAAAPRPGVTRELKWVHFGSDLELLDSPGILPMRISDQVAAIKLAICDDIGERSYDVCDVAVILVQMLCKLPGVGSKSLYNRYRINTDGSCGRTFLDRLSLHMFGGNVNQAAFRILTDYRKGKFGWFALERPPK